MAKFIVHNPNTEEDSYKIASLLFMSANNKKFDTPVKLMICGYENIILYNS